MCLHCPGQKESLKEYPVTRVEHRAGQAKDMTRPSHRGSDESAVLRLNVENLSRNNSGAEKKLPAFLAIESQSAVTKHKYLMAHAARFGQRKR